jgi:uncharacterized repeat protein (TIGR01451 family)
MKTVLRMPGLVTRLGLVAMALLFGQQALAVGTDAGTDVTNIASVSYSVNGTGQTAIPSNSADFVVDRIVTFDVSNLNVSPFATVEPNATGMTYYRVTNTSNSPLDFDLVADNLSGTIVDGNTDNADMVTPFEIRVAAPNVDTAGTPPASGAPIFVDALPEDQFIDVYVFSDAPASVNDGDFGNVFLRGIAHDPDDGAPGYNPAPDGNLGAILTEDPNTAAGIENVFNDAGVNDLPNNGQEEAYWGFEHSSASLTITKAATVIDGPFAPGSLLAIPGATIEYTITIVNNGTADATDISISDDVDGDVNFITDAYNGGAANIEFVLNGGAATFCNADDNIDTDQDGCSINGATLTIAGTDAATAPPAAPTFAVAAGDTMEISFQVFIPDAP